MKITILNSSIDHPVNSWLEAWVARNQEKHDVQILRSKQELGEGDILFLISCSEIISKTDRSKFRKTLIIHASDLPRGRGWSPHIWEIINGSELITLSLLEAEDKVDSGDIWKKMQVRIPKMAMYDQINKIIFDAELELMDFAVNNLFIVTPTKQTEENLTYWPKRSPDDSEVNIFKTLDEQFDLIRVCDPKRFPAFFYKNGKKFNIRIEAVDK
ncbi:MAG: methionyl-tRNA formyltransferase [Enterobacterales bacterium]|jgi:methionyl-tRNA formyltransferase